MFKLVDSNLEQYEWKTPQAGPGIGDAIPYVPGIAMPYGYRTWPGKLEFYIQNAVITPKTPSWLGAISRQLPPAGYSHLAFEFDLVLDGYSAKYGRCFEFDIRNCLAGLGYNCSSQFNQATGLWEISDVNGNWVSTGYKYPNLMPWSLQRMRIEYFFDYVNKKYGVQQIEINDYVPFVVPAKLQNLAATPLAWEDSCNVQVQQDMYGLLGGFSQMMQNINLEWTA